MKTKDKSRGSFLSVKLPLNPGIEISWASSMILFNFGNVIANSRSSEQHSRAWITRDTPAWRFNMHNSRNRIMD